MQVHRAGLTLIELMTVIAIISVLIALVLPVLFLGREKARSKQCISNLSQLGKGFLLYLQDWNETFPTAGDLGANPGTAWVAYNHDTAGRVYAEPERGAIFPYVRNVEVYACPSDSLARSLRLSYQMNSTVGYIDPIAVHYSEIRKPAELILLLETVNQYYIGPAIGVFGGGCKGLPPSTVLPCPSDPIPCNGDRGCLEVLSCRHAGSATNALFCDGHVRAFPKGMLPCRYIEK